MKYNGPPIPLNKFGKAKEMPVKEVVTKMLTCTQYEQLPPSTELTVDNLFAGDRMRQAAYVYAGENSAPSNS